LRTATLLLAALPLLLALPLAGASACYADTASTPVGGVYASGSPATQSGNVGVSGEETNPEPFDGCAGLSGGPSSGGAYRCWKTPWYDWEHKYECEGEVFYRGQVCYVNWYDNDADGHPYDDGDEEIIEVRCPA